MCSCRKVCVGIYFQNPLSLWWYSYIHCLFMCWIWQLQKKRGAFRLNIVSGSPLRSPQSKNHQTPHQLCFSNTICRSFLFFFFCQNSKLRLFSLQICKSAAAVVNFEDWCALWQKRLLLAASAEKKVKNPRSYSRNWVRPESAQPPTPHPQRRRSCISQDSDGNLFFLEQQIIPRSMTVCERAALSSASPSAVEMKERRWKEKKKKENNNAEPTWRSLLNTWRACFRIAFIPFPQWDCGKGVLGIDVHVFSPVYQLSCLD